MTPTIVVTGGGPGIGAAVVRRLAADGERVSAAALTSERLRMRQWTPADAGFVLDHPVRAFWAVERAEDGRLLGTSC
jgi:NAD(P)-dependent dehydrogenase (short-subunit alcohol dehydrogenase family)